MSSLTISITVWREPSHAFPGSGRRRAPWPSWPARWRTNSNRARACAARSAAGTAAIRRAPAPQTAMGKACRCIAGGARRLDDGRQGWLRVSPSAVRASIVPSRGAATPDHEPDRLRCRCSPDASAIRQARPFHKYVSDHATVDATLDHPSSLRPAGQCASEDAASRGCGITLSSVTQSAHARQSLLASRRGTTRGLLDKFGKEAGNPPQGAVCSCFYCGAAIIPSE